MFRRQADGPLKVFIHVPKTAGSTVNAHLAAWGRGLDHVEHFRGREGVLQRKLTTQRWVSGHLALNKMQALLGTAGGRDVEYFGLIRDPMAQLMSHYNWLIEIAHRGGRFFRAHHVGIQRYAERLHASDNSDPTVVLKNIQARPRMFLNLQARFLLGDDLVFSKDTGRRRLDHYKGLHIDPEALVADLTGHAPKTQEARNASSYHFDKAVFRDPVLRAYIDRHNGFDAQLYRLIAARAALDS